MSFLHDVLLDDEAEFVVYVRKHNTPETVKKLVITDKARFWYCRWFGNDKEIASKITSDKWLVMYSYYIENMYPINGGHMHKIKDYAQARKNLGGYLHESNLKAIKARIAMIEASQKNLSTKEK